ncbi:nitrous oxide reductase accessory protein NosL [Paenibacillus athensensis]|uniref:Copper chaperone NosL n=1 Tax=Paenibacillus athensensis TaxID=1967502 RepID=A0A4Y8PWB3_9BACL|nr:nitrous oxide reductase accessory protein NosL [Paenibacillus athensensis]MCD1261430.1 nitrous oxide reductase accessory protein NosL [Paenibacillus athensensis]
MKTWNWLIAIAAVVLILSACGAASYEPSPIDEAVDKCPICNMAVADDQFAVEIILKDKKALKFDDLGDLYVWKQRNGTANIGEQFVRDYQTKEWIKLSEATYVYDKSIRTPMAFNVISFKEKKDAEAFKAKEGKGEILSAEQLEQHKWEPNDEMMKGMMHEHEGEMNMDGMGAADSGKDGMSDSKSK